MIERLIRDESGMTMGLVVIVVVLIGVMGAGLLTFITADLKSMAQTNRGQQALQIADAGVQAAKQQLIRDAAATTSYDGGTDDRPWSYCYGIPGCSSSAPTPDGSDGMTLNMDAGSAKVTILMTSSAPATYRVISEGQVAEARRKIEAFIRSEADLTFPRTYVTRTNLTITGSAQPAGASFFALGDATLQNNNVDLGTQDDRYYGKWAETTGAGPYPNADGSYPNSSNATPRSTTLSGVAAWGNMRSGTDATQVRGARVFGSTYSRIDGTPVTGVGPVVVPDYAASPITPSSGKIAFPFRVPTESQDRQEINALRQRALSQETMTNPLYMDSTPGNNVNDVGMGYGALNITTWPSPSNYDTVRFYEFEAYSATNVVRYENNAPEASCSSTNPPKGVIVVENGDFLYDGNRAFNGGIIVRAYDPSGASIPTQGKFTASGNPCLKGYANSGGNMSISGQVQLGDAPELGTLDTFSGGTEQISWRELYE